MRRFLPFILILCLAAGLGGTALADDTAEAEVLSTSVLCRAGSFSAQRNLFDGFGTASVSGQATRAMAAAALGRYYGADSTPGTGTGRVSSGEAELMAAPDGESQSLGTVSGETELTISGLSGSWLRVSADGKEGYLPRESVEALCSGYTDVSYGSWYGAYAVWACDTGLMTAEEGSFQPEGLLTRDSLCLLLQNYLTLTGATLPAINETFPFTDADSLSQQSLQAARAMQTAGVLCEKENGAFLPDGTVSASELEGVLLRFFQNLTPAFNFQPVPVSSVAETAPVGDSWFDDACFIGHSQVVGMAKYFGLDNADYYSIIGYTAQQILDFDYFELPNGRHGTLAAALEQKTYGKVYIMLGINDCSMREDRIERFLAPMRELVELVQQTQPDARVYLLSLAPVGRATANNLCYNPDNVVLYSQALKALSREYGTEYLDVFRLLSDEEGYLRGDIDAGDSIHIAAGSYSVLKDFLRCHI